MSQLNRKRKRVGVPYVGEVTHNGAPAAKLSYEKQLERAVNACLLWEDTFYEDGVSISARIKDLVSKVPAHVSSRIARRARNEFYMRHVPLLIVREKARLGHPDVRATLVDVIQRPDELTEFLAIYWKDAKQPLSAQVKKGLADALGKFNEYQLAKYNGKREIRLRDVLRLVHPKPKDRQQELLYKKIIEDTLEAPNTWEVRLSGGENKRDVFEDLIKTNQLGGLALLRNLRGMNEAGVPRDVVRGAIKANQFSRVLPFRFLTAARFAPHLEPDLEAAMFRATEGMTKLPGKTVLLLDNSGSMEARLSAKGDTTRSDAAAGVGILLREICEDIEVISFGRKAVQIPARRGMALRDAYQRAATGKSTNTAEAKKLADKLGYDRIIIVTDEQSDNVVTAPISGAKGYIMNVANYKNGISYNKWTNISGWSESVVRFIQTIEE